jgi:hypothetical protein
MPAERPTPGEAPIKPGETRETTPADYLWMKALLRYTRTVELATNVPDDVPNMTTLFSGFTFTSTYRPGRLILLFRSWHHTDHAHDILNNVFERDPRQPLRPNVSLKVLNTESAENNLMMKGFAEPVAPEDMPTALAAYNAVRRLKDTPEWDAAPKNEEDTVPEMLFAVTVLSAQTQGERYSKIKNHVGEVHPQIHIPSLLGFEALPPLDTDNMPLTKHALRTFLRSKGYYIPN